MCFRNRALATVVIVALSVFMFPRALVRMSAWGAVGHRVVARLAWALMTPAARSQATTLLVESGGPELAQKAGMDAFVGAATWADEVRPARPETYNWHFVDIPVGEPRYDAARDCPATERGDCVIAAIARLRIALVGPAPPAPSVPPARPAGPGAVDVKRTEALKFLIHFVGDLHQPLHSIDNHDRGGNDVRVNALREDGRATNLHAVWDTGLINLSSETEVARADRLLAVLQALPRPAGEGLDVVKWVEESHEMGVRVVYRYPSFSPIVARPLPTGAVPPLTGAVPLPTGAVPSTTAMAPEPITLDEAYRAAAVMTIDRQLAVAGARLAALVNSLLK